MYSVVLCQVIQLCSIFARDQGPPLSYHLFSVLILRLPPAPFSPRPHLCVLSRSLARSFPRALDFPCSLSLGSGVSLSSLPQTHPHTRTRTQTVTHTHAHTQICRLKNESWILTKSLSESAWNVIVETTLFTISNLPGLKSQLIIPVSFNHSTRDRTVATNVFQ